MRGIVVIVVVAISAVAFVLIQKPLWWQELVSPSGILKGDSASVEEFTGSIFELAERGDSYRCTFSRTDDAAQSEGVVYVDGDRFRGDFATTASGLTVESHLIMRDGFMYFWTPLAPQGFKAVRPPQGARVTSTTTPQYRSLNEVYTYACRPWTLDESQFTLPVLAFIDIP